MTLPPEEGGSEVNVIACLWVRTVKSPDPAWDGHVPLTSSWILRKAKKNKSVVWVEPLVDHVGGTVIYKLRKGGQPVKGTMARTAATCVATGTPMPRDYLKSEATAGRMGSHLIAVVAEGKRSRTYLPAVQIPQVDITPTVPSAKLSTNSQYMGTPLYGMGTTDSLFTDRQLVALSTFSGLLGEVRSAVENDARAAGLVDNGVRLRDGGYGIPAYADAVVTYLAFVIDRCAAMWASLARWNSTAEKIQHMFGRQAIPMIWDYAEANPFSNSSGNWLGQVKPVQGAVASLPGGGKGEIIQRDVVARNVEVPSPVVCTDPPYYDNVPYADISDFFYVWLRHNLYEVWPEETATLLTPKVEELIANSHRAGSNEKAKKHFEERMASALKGISNCQHPNFPATSFTPSSNRRPSKETLLQPDGRPFYKVWWMRGCRLLLPGR